MKKRSTGTNEAGAKASGLSKEVVGLDLGDRTSDLCVSGEDGAIVEEGRVQTTQPGMTRWFEGKKRMRVVMEVGTHSPWVSRLLTDLGHEVLVANPDCSARTHRTPSCTGLEESSPSECEWKRGGRLSPGRPNGGNPHRLTATGPSHGSPLHARVRFPYAELRSRSSG